MKCCPLIKIAILSPDICAWNSTRETNDKSGKLSGEFTMGGEGGGKGACLKGRKTARLRKRITRFLLHIHRTRNN